MSAKTGAGLDELRARARARPGARARRAAGRRGSTSTASSRSAASAPSSPARSGRAPIAAGDRLRVEPSGRSVRVRSVQVHDTAVESRRGGAAGRRQPARRSSGATLAARRRPRRAGSLPAELPPRHPPDGARAAAGGRHRSPRDDGRARRAWRAPASTRSSGWRRRWSPRAATASCCGRDTTVGGGIVLDPAPPRGLDADRLRVLEGGDPAAIVGLLVHEPVSRAGAPGAAGCSRRHELARGLRGVARRASSYFSDEPGSTSFASASGRGSRNGRAASPLDPGVPLAELLPPEPWAPARRRPARRRAPRRHGVPARARPRASATARRPRPSSRPSSRRATR